jgi:hypothetical protein
VDSTGTQEEEENDDDEQPGDDKPGAAIHGGDGELLHQS